ncbi:hypothetical protein [Lihuaxuella thermophila]|uniref:Uncharacterized protein n=1 Tax=Lihuaxuella thermophila TaxID=1173111 RepID=A0A1H8HA69_9BACL|nr:hypothetical protein [Lihuaxuella thermophila]SEN53153.1 hypothetical protein SAMN05444955_113114 [Lihuaxuella thermophila]
MKQLNQEQRKIIIKSLGLLQKQIQDVLDILTAPGEYRITMTQYELKQVSSIIETLKSDEEVIL